LRRKRKKESEAEEEGEKEKEKKNGFVGLPFPGKLSSVSKLSMSMKNTSLGEKGKSKKYSGTNQENGYVGFSSGERRSANEQLPVSASFVKLADMNEEEWGVFLEKFQEELYPAFAKRRSVVIGQRQRQRLGTSCQF